MNQIVGLKRFFCFLSCLNCLLSWDKNLINHDFHRRRLQEVMFIITYIAEGNRPKSQAGAFLCFQAGRSSATRSSASDRTVVNFTGNYT